MINFYGKALPILRKCMRISTIIIGIQICCTSLLLAKSGKAQEMNLDVVKVNVKQVFKKIEQQAKVTFVYDEQVINTIPALTLHIKNKSLPEVLNQLQNSTLLQFKMVGNYIGVAQNIAAMPTLTIAPQAEVNMNQIKVSGVVRDASGQPIPGVTVRLKGSATIGTQTDINGQFSLSANIGDVLTFKFIGYLPKEITVSAPTLSVLLNEDSKQLSEVVVTALGIKKDRKALGYSVTEVKGDELTQAREPNVINSLEGKVAGLNVTPTAGGPDHHQT